MAKEIAPGEWLIGAQFKGDGSDYYDQDSTGLNTCSGPGEKALTPRWSNVLEVALEELMISNITVVVLGIFYPCGNPSAISFICTWKELVNAGNPGGTKVGHHADIEKVIDDELVYNRYINPRANTANIIGDIYRWENDPIHIFGIVLRPS